MRKTTDCHAGERGFTLIELMIVVAIIAILAGILIPNFVNARAQAQTSACESNLRAIATAMELYYADNQRYPDAGNIPDALNTTTVTYLNTTPRDPADAGATPARRRRSIRSRNRRATDKVTSSYVRAYTPDPH